MDVFKRHDLLGLGFAALFLVMVYLVLSKGLTVNTILGTIFSGANNSFKTLQGR